MLGSGTKFPPAFPPPGLSPGLTQAAPGAFIPGQGLPRPSFPPPFPAAKAQIQHGMPGQGMAAPQPVMPAGMASGLGSMEPAPGGPAPSGSTDLLIMIRQGVAVQDKPKVIAALQMAQHLGTAIDPPIMNMLRQWLGDEIFASVMVSSTKAPPSVPPKAASPSIPPMGMAQQTQMPSTNTAAFAKTAAGSPGGCGVRPQPLMLIRQGVAAQDKAGVRYALRLAVQEGSTIDKAVCDMLRQWLGENDEALNLLSGMTPAPLPSEQVQPQEAMAASSAKAAPTAPPTAAETEAPGRGELPSESRESPSAKPSGPPPGQGPANSAPKAAKPVVAAAPVIRRGPVLKGAAAPPEPPPPDFDASFDSFLKELGSAEEPEADKDDGPAAKKQRVDADATDGAPLPPQEDAPPPPPEEEKPPPPKPVVPAAPKKPAAKPKPKPPGPTKDEWGRELPTEPPREKEAWEYLQERATLPDLAAAAGNFIDFNSF
mmetsp:Transcript_52178/g.93581  ORF Transcript_52178/g.93581 Transcript_52178/m.93581 type:complete len:484 (-) Transcript_52178:70-1521(-)